MKNVLMVIAQRMFRDEEYAEPKEVLEDHGVNVVTASERAGHCEGKLGMEAEASVSVADAEALDYDAVVFVGGPGASAFFDDPASHALARTAFDNGRVVAAICIGPSTLAHAGLLDGVQATAFESQRADLIEQGALWTGDSVTVDGRIITANGPAAARRFGEAIAEAIGV